MQPWYHTSPRNTNQKQKPAIIPGGLYLISPLALVSVWAALKSKLITWHHLCVWIALFEVRAWRDSMEPAQRNLFRFTTRQVTQALGKTKSGPRLKKALAELEELHLARLTPTKILFTSSLDDLPADLRTETERMLKSLGTRNVSRSMRMPRRLMRLIMTSRVRPLRAAVIFGILLRIMPVKRYGRYKGCLTTALLVDLSGFNESRIKHERASLVREGYFERLETPFRVRQQYGDWYALPHDLPVSSDPQNTKKRQSSVRPQKANPQPPMKEPVPSFGIETNQYLPENSGASRSISTPEPTAPPTWQHIQTEDLRDPQRRVDLHKDACRSGVIGNSPTERLKFYAAIARARRLGTLNPCGMLRRIIQTSSYHRYIADCDEDQARAWLAKDLSTHLDAGASSSFLRQFTESPTRLLDEHSNDSILATHLTSRLREEGFPTRDAFKLIMTTELGRTKLAGWTQDRWNRAIAQLK